jgi:uncharacterized protein YerC
MTSEGTASAKIKPEKAGEIRKRYAARGVTTRDLAAEYGVSALTISKIIRNIFWVDPSYTPPEISKQRRREGDRSLTTRLTPDQARQIRQRYTTEEGASTRVLGKEYGVSPHTISKITRGLLFPEV